MKFEDIPMNVRSDLKKACISIEELIQASPKEVFSMWCQWEGLINYDTTIWNIVVALHKSEGKPKESPKSWSNCRVCGNTIYYCDKCKRPFCFNCSQAKCPACHHDYMGAKI